MDAFLNPCVRSDGERLDPSLSPAPSLLAEDGRGVLYALGADGVIRACPARLLNAAARGSITARRLLVLGWAAFVLVSVECYAAALTANLTVQGLRPRINSILDCQLARCRLCVHGAQARGRKPSVLRP